MRTAQTGLLPWMKHRWKLWRTDSFALAAESPSSIIQERDVALEGAKPSSFSHCLYFLFVLLKLATKFGDLWDKVLKSAAPTATSRHFIKVLTFSLRFSDLIWINVQQLLQKESSVKHSNVQEHRSKHQRRMNIVPAFSVFSFPSLLAVVPWLQPDLPQDCDLFLLL